jgi:hypothetical protein
MSLLHDAVQEKKFDTRVIEKNLSRNLVRQDEYDKFVKSLPDDSNLAETISMEALLREVETDRQKSGSND